MPIQEGEEASGRPAAKAKPKLKPASTSNPNFIPMKDRGWIDIDFEDGEIRKLLTSSLCAQGASGRPDAMDIQESEVHAQTSHSSEGREATGRPVALISPRRNEQRNQAWSSVFGNA